MYLRRYVVVDKNNIPRKNELDDPYTFTANDKKDALKIYRNLISEWGEWYNKFPVKESKLRREFYNEYSY
jgi:hypothetical protein